jgi:hypothetical protein
LGQADEGIDERREEKRKEKDEDLRRGRPDRVGVNAGHREHREEGRERLI